MTDNPEAAFSRAAAATVEYFMGRFDADPELAHHALGHAQVFASTFLSTLSESAPQSVLNSAFGEVTGTLCQVLFAFGDRDEAGTIRMPTYDDCMLMFDRLLKPRHSDDETDTSTLLDRVHALPDRVHAYAGVAARTCEELEPIHLDWPRLPPSERFRIVLDELLPDDDGPSIPTPRPPTT